MILNEEIPESRGLFDYRRVEIVIAERLKGLQHRGLEAATIPKSRCSARLLDDPLVEFLDLFDGDVSHYESRRYSSAFFSRTRSATLSNCASR